MCARNRRLEYRQAGQVNQKPRWKEIYFYGLVFLKATIGQMPPSAMMQLCSVEWLRNLSMEENLNLYDAAFLL